MWERKGDKVMLWECVCIHMYLHTPLLPVYAPATFSLIIPQLNLNQVRHQYIHFLKDRLPLCFWGRSALSAWTGVINWAPLSDAGLCTLPHVLPGKETLIWWHISTLLLKARCVLFGGHVVSIQTHACSHPRVVVVSEVELILVSSNRSRSLMLWLCVISLVLP